MDTDPAGPQPAPQPGPAPAAKPPAKPAGRVSAGRNLPVAIGVGAALGGLVILTLLTVKATFLIYVGVALAIALSELAGALSRGLSHDGVSLIEVVVDSAVPMLYAPRN